MQSKPCDGRRLTDSELEAIVDATLLSIPEPCRSVLLIVPDGTRTAPLGTLFKAVHRRLAQRGARADVLVALGTHAPMSEEAICSRLGLALAERRSAYPEVRFHNHAWNDPAQLALLGTIPAGETAKFSNGRFSVDVPVSVNRRLLEYDHLLIIGPVFPHEVVGFSGGNKYLFPGVSGAEILNFFHWLGALITSPAIIGVADTPVRAVIDRAAAMVPTPTTALCMVVADGGIVSCHGGPVDTAWRAATVDSARFHIRTFPKPFQRVLACAPLMYDELWVGAKCMYKLEPVVADGGELIIHAPHINRISKVHGQAIERIGYHCRDYFTKQWERFANEPWGILAHSTHVRGVGTFSDGVENGRIRVTLATGIPEETCRKVGLGYRDPATIQPEDWARRDEDGLLVVRDAGEILHRLNPMPEWCRFRLDDPGFTNK